MSPKHVLLVGTPDEVARLDDLAAGLRRRGHSTQIAQGVDSALGMETPDALVVTEAVGVALFQAFSLPTSAPRGVFLVEQAAFELACEAARVGAQDILCRPTIDALATAIEQGPARALPAPTSHFEQVYTSDQVHTAVRDLLAFGTRLGLTRGLRMRFATAASELLTNAAQHAYGDTLGPVTVYVRLSNDPLGIDRLSLEIVDHGAGADEVQAPGAGPSGLDFVRALAERVDLTTTPGRGFAARAEFALASLYFDETPAGLDELDYIDPIALRELHSVMTSGEDVARIAPALAPTLGRIQAAGRDPLASLSLR